MTSRAIVAISGTRPVVNVPSDPVRRDEGSGREMADRRSCLPIPGRFARRNCCGVRTIRCSARFGRNPRGIGASYDSSLSFPSVRETLISASMFGLLSGLRHPSDSAESPKRTASDRFRSSRSMLSGSLQPRRSFLCRDLPECGPLLRRYRHIDNSDSRGGYLVRLAVRSRPLRCAVTLTRLSPNACQVNVSRTNHHTDRPRGTEIVAGVAAG